MLYLVPTPIGNLQDMTFRAVEQLKAVDLILAEDTRVTGKLLKHYEIDSRMSSFHQHNEHRQLDSMLDRLESGEEIALVSDAGTPGISDPGFLLVRGAIGRGIEVICLPGATALIPALVSSGFPTDRFVFEGFLPQKKGRNKRMEFLKQEERTVVFYESPHRLIKLLEEIKKHFGEERKVCVVREVSKMFEEKQRGTASELIALFEDKGVKGEFVVLVEGK